MAMRSFRFVCYLLCVLSFVVPVLNAQVQNGQLAGVVTDPSGAAIANAKVSVLNPSTNFTDTTMTNQSGAYTIKELPIGEYKVTVEAAGFTQDRRDVDVIAKAEAAVTISLAPVEVVYPKPEEKNYPFSSKPVSVFTGAFEVVTRFKVDGRAPAGPGVLVGKLRYQACSDDTCYRPATLEIRLPYEIR